MFNTEEYSEFAHVSHEHMQILMTCYSISSACAKMCIEENHAETAKLCSECADICALTIKWHSADSAFATLISQVCAEVCTQCAEACGSMESEHCQQCSDICFECADVCREEL